jgi:hypothetical protein
MKAMPTELTTDSIVKSIHGWANERLDFDYETLRSESPVVHYNVELKGPDKGGKGAAYVCLYLSRSLYKCLDSDYESTFWIPLEGGPCIWNPFRSWCDHSGHAIELRGILDENDLARLLDETCGGIIRQAVLGAALLTWAVTEGFKTERRFLGADWNDNADDSDEEDCLDCDGLKEEKKQNPSHVLPLNWDLYYCTTHKSKRLLRIAISTGGDVAPFEESGESGPAISNAVTTMNRTELIEWLDDLAAEEPKSR